MHNLSLRQNRFLTGFSEGGDRPLAILTNQMPMSMTVLLDGHRL